MIENFIEIEGEFSRQKDMDAGQLENISREMITKMAAEFGYVPAGREKDDRITIKKEETYGR